MKPALIVFAKAPVAGEVKTRLAARLGTREAAELYRAFLEDSLQQFATLPVDVRLAVAPPLSAMDDIDVPEGVSLHDQKGADLGARMSRAFAEAFAQGYQRVAVVGTDHPTLPSAFIEQAFASIVERRSMAIGPADDGGYYLLAMNDFIPQVFLGMRYSHSAVFEQTLRRAAEAGVAITVLPAWYDVDDAGALERLSHEVHRENVRVPRTRRILAHLAERHQWLRH